MAISNVSNIFKSAGPADTARLAGFFAASLRGGLVLLLDGPIGAGKTFFTRELARALGAKRLPVSASFSMMRSYPGRLKLFHFDLFRAGGADLENIGIEEFLGRPDGVAVMEWASPAEELTAGLPGLRLEFGLAGGDRRDIKVTCLGVTRDILAAVKQEWKRN